MRTTKMLGSILVYVIQRYINLRNVVRLLRGLSNLMVIIQNHSISWHMSTRRLKIRNIKYLSMRLDFRGWLGIIKWVKKLR